MKKIFEVWKSSIYELKNIYCLTLCGILAALTVALKFTASIDIGEYIRIGFSELPAIAASALFGPAVGGIFWGMCDIIKYIVAPNGPFFPGFTISAAVNGIIYGYVLYKRPVTLANSFWATLLSKVIVTLGLNSYWLCVLYGNGFIAVLATRIVGAVVMLPINVGITFVMMRFVMKVYRSQGLIQRS